MSDLPSGHTHLAPLGFNRHKNSQFILTHGFNTERETDRQREKRYPEASHSPLSKLGDELSLRCLTLLLFISVKHQHAGGSLHRQLERDGALSAIFVHAEHAVIQRRGVHIVLKHVDTERLRHACRKITPNHAAARNTHTLLLHSNYLYLLMTACDSVCLPLFIYLSFSLSVS